MNSVRDRALEALRVLAELAPVRAAYVFGSQVTGSTNRWSDIDLAAFMEGVEPFDIRRRAKAMSLVHRRAGLDVAAHLFPASAWRNPAKASFAEYV